MNDLLVASGFQPAHQYSLLFPLAALGIWLLFLPVAYLRRIKTFYNASVKAAIFEEVLFRGLVYGGVLFYTHNAVYAVIFSSLTFGLFHMRNLWWASWRRSWSMTVYAGLTAGPIFALIRFLTGDIYLGILVHFLHNFVVIMTPGLLGKGTARTPTDDELHLARVDRSAKVDH
jgi:membrane protease YdiL (CAAX protease family)